MKSSMEAYTLVYVNRQPMGISCRLRELTLGFCNNLERWEWVGAWRETQEGGDICTPIVNAC